jgi:hypothetical protein
MVMINANSKTKRFNREQATNHLSPIIIVLASDLPSEHDSAQLVIAICRQSRYASSAPASDSFSSGRPILARFSDGGVCGSSPLMLESFLSNSFDRALFRILPSSRFASARLRAGDIHAHASTTPDSFSLDISTPAILKGGEESEYIVGAGLLSARQSHRRLQVFLLDCFSGDIFVILFTRAEAAVGNAIIAESSLQFKHWFKKLGSVPAQMPQELPP